MQIEGLATIVKPSIPNIGSVDIPVQKDITQIISDINLKDSVITLQQKTQFVEKVRELYQIVDETMNQISVPNQVSAVLVSLQAISEHYVKGKKLGETRRLLVLNEIQNFLKTRNILLDNIHIVFLKALNEGIFKWNENKLQKIFNDIFQTGTACFQASTNILNYIVK